jgi:Ca-activated chloride channel family protein
MKYDLTVHTLPEVTKKDITINPGKHNVIAVDAPQGMLKLEMSGMNEYSDLKCLVRKHGDLNTFHVQNFEEVTKYIVGDYDLEILTLPRIKVNKVNIAQSHTTKVFIADPGLATIFLPAKGIASIFVQENNTLKWIYNLSPNSTRETVILQPGSYHLVYRSVNSKKVIETKEKSFKITSGVSTQLKF